MENKKEAEYEEAIIYLQFENRTLYIILAFILLGLMLFGCSGTRNYDFDAKLNNGMYKYEVTKTMLEQPRKVYKSKLGDVYIYYYWDSWSGWLPRTGTRYIQFDKNGKLIDQYGWGYKNGK